MSNQRPAFFGPKYRLTLGCRKYTRGSYQYCARAKPKSGTDN